MGRIKLDDLPEDMEVTREEMKKVMGGGYLRFSGRTGGFRRTGDDDSKIPTTYGACYNHEWCY